MEEHESKVVGKSIGVVKALEMILVNVEFQSKQKVSANEYCVWSPI